MEGAALVADRYAVFLVLAGAELPAQSKLNFSFQVYQVFTNAILPKVLRCLGNHVREELKLHAADVSVADGNVKKYNRIVRMPKLLLNLAPSGHCFGKWILLCYPK